MATATATKPQRAVKRLGYDDVRKEANKPIKSRRERPIGLGGALRIPRNQDISEQKLSDLRQLHENGDKLPNPQNRGGNYYAIIEAYKQLGLNKKHPIKLVIAKIREIMSDSSLKDGNGKVMFPKDADGKTAWQSFRDKEPATEREEGGADPIERIVTNHTTLQRVNSVTSATPYGLKLLQVGQKILKTAGCTIDLLKGETEKDIYGRLNTDSAVPVNELRRQRGSTPKVAKTKAKVAKKAAPAKKAPAKKAKVTKTEKTGTENPKVKKIKSDHPASDKVTPVVPAPETPTALAASEPAPVEEVV